MRVGIGGESGIGRRGGVYIPVIGIIEIFIIEKRREVFSEFV